MAELSKDL